MNSKVDKLFLVDLPIVFVERQLKRAQRRALWHKQLFVWFNVMTILFTFALSTITTLVVSSTLPATDYFFTATIASTAVTFATTIFNFLLVKELAKKYKDQYEFILSEIIKYETNQGIYSQTKDKDFEIFHRVCVYMEYPIAKERDETRS